MKIELDSIQKRIIDFFRDAQTYKVYLKRQRKSFDSSSQIIGFNWAITLELG